MEPRLNQPARFVKYMARILILIIIFAGIPVTPVAARPAGAHVLSFDTGNKTSLDIGISDGALIPGDFDNDGDMDLLASGMTIDNTGKTTIFRNDGVVGGKVVFHEQAAGMQQLQFSSAAWGDYDNDGYLDVLLTGQLRVEGGSNVIGFAGLYHNIPSGGGRGFTLKQSLPNIYQGSGTFGDYNNDGLLDILLTGYTDNGATFSRLYRNTGNFSGTVYDSTGTPAVIALGASAAAWGDYDRDGDMDFAISGKTAANVPTTRYYRNNGNGTFAATDLTGVWGGTVNFFDYNLDGYLDLLVTGNSGGSVSPDIQPSTILYRYYSAAPNFREVSSTGLPNLWNSTVSVGDYDNDGYPDLAMGGKTLTLLPNQVFRNNHNGTFTDVNAGLPDGAGTALAWGDFNGDLSLDLALTGIAVFDVGTGGEKYYTYIYPNAPTSANDAPTAPVLTSACWNGTNRLTLSWGAASDPSAPTSSLSYNVRMGTTLNGFDTVNPSSDLATGFHRLSEPGNTFARTSATLLNLPFGDYYWSVQAVDSSYAGGPFADSTNRVINYGDAVGVNDPDYATQDDTVLKMTVLGNDLGSGSPLSVLSFTGPSHGTLARDTVDPDVLVYTPRAPYQGTDSFTYYAIRTTSLYCSRATVTITVSQHNDPPTDIALAPSQVPFGAPIGTLVGNFSTTDPDAAETFTYTLVPTAGGSNLDNASFSITGNQLFTAVVMNDPGKPTYQIYMRSTDHGGLWKEKTFTITVVPNRAPTDITLTQDPPSTPAAVLEHQPVNYLVGTLSTTDPDSGDVIFTYTLEPYPGHTCDNDVFKIGGTGNSSLLTNAVFDYNTRQAYQVCIRSTDPGGLSFQKAIPINILPTTPTLSTQTAFPVVMSEDGLTVDGIEDAFHLNISGFDRGVGEAITWSIAQPAVHGTAAASGTTTNGQLKAIAYTPAANWNSDGGRGNDTFVVRATDPGGHFADMAVTVTVNGVNDPPIFDAVNNIALPERSGRQSITITGIKPGPLYEDGQFVELTAYCPPTPPTNPCPPPIPGFITITPVQANGTAVLTFNVGTGTGTIPIVISARDNQPRNNTFSRAFDIIILKGISFYLPFIRR